MYEVLFQYGLITVKTFDLLLSASFIVGALVITRFIQIKKMKFSFLSENLFYLILFSLIGGRVFYIFEHFNYTRNNPLSILTLWDLHFSPFGILYTFLAVLLYFCHKQKKDFWAWLDAFVLTGLSALVIIHIGHFFNGTHYGTLTNLPWGISFDTFNIPFIKPIHPTQIYSAITTFLIANYIFRFVKRTHLTGMAGNLGFMLYSLSAFLIDFLHGSPSPYARANYLLIAAISFIFYTHCSHRKLFS